MKREGETKNWIGWLPNAMPGFAVPICDEIRRRQPLGLASEIVHQISDVIEHVHLAGEGARDRAGRPSGAR